MQQQIELHIDELVLHGFSPHQRYAIAEAVQMELTRLFQEQPMPAIFQNEIRMPSINAGSFSIDNLGRSELTGNKIANVVYNSFGK